MRLAAAAGTPQATGISAHRTATCQAPAPAPTPRRHAQGFFEPLRGTTFNNLWFRAMYENPHAAYWIDTTFPSPSVVLGSLLLFSVTTRASLQLGSWSHIMSHMRFCGWRSIQ